MSKQKKVSELFQIRDGFKGINRLVDIKTAPSHVVVYGTHGKAGQYSLKDVCLFSSGALFNGNLYTADRSVLEDVINRLDSLVGEPAFKVMGRFAEWMAKKENLVRFREPLMTTDTDNIIVRYENLYIKEKGKELQLRGDVVILPKLAEAVTPCIKTFGKMDLYLKPRVDAKEITCLGDDDSIFRRPILKVKRIEAVDISITRSGT